MSSERSVGKKSGKYWQYFELVTYPVSKKPRTICQLCPTKESLAYNGNTSSMSNHLKGKHHINLSANEKPDERRLPGMLIITYQHYIPSKRLLFNERNLKYL